LDVTVSHQKLATQGESATLQTELDLVPKAAVSRLPEAILYNQPHLASG